MNRLFKYALMLCFVGIAIFALNQMSDGAEGADVKWDGGGSNNLASTAANWQGDSLPAIGDTIIFDSTSTKNCVMNVDFVKGGETVIKAAWIKINSGYTGVIYLNYTAYFSTAFEINSGTFVQNYSFQSVYGMKQTGGTWYLNKNAANYAGYGGYGFTQEGGTIICGSNGRIYNNETFLIGGGTTTDLVVYQAGTANFKTVNTIKTLVLTGGTVTQNGIIKIGSGGITQSGGTFVKGSFDLTLYSPSTLTMTSDFGIDYCYLNASCGGSGSFSVDDVLTIKGSFVQRIYYNGTADVSTDQQHWTGWLYTQNDIAIEYNSYAYLEFNHDAWLGIQLESWSGTDNFTWNATSVASQTVQWSWSRGESNAMYDEYMDGIYIGSDENNAGGMGSFTSTIVGTHAFLLSRSSFLPASTDIDDSVWLAILFMSIATIINFVGYIKKIGLLQIVSFLILLASIFTMTDAWSEGWALPTLFVLSNAVLFIMGLMRR